MFRLPFRIFFAAVASISCLNLTACQSTGGSSPGKLMDYRPNVAFMGGTDAFSTKPEKFRIGVVYEVARGYINRVEVELDGAPAGSHSIVEMTPKGKFQFDIDASALSEGEHELRITVFQGKHLSRQLKSSTETLKFVVIK